MKPRPRVLLELIRIPNAFTAVADVLAGFLCADGGWNQRSEALLLCLASCCLYSGGMALNDVCDAAEDFRDRPTRPIPGGRVSRRFAFGLSFVLLLLGCLLAWLASVRSAKIALILIAAIVLYDAILKSTRLGALLMGLCRSLNFALGLSVFGPLDSPGKVAPVLLVGFYTSSVTYFARDEAVTSRAPRLVLGTLGYGVAVIAVGCLPWMFGEIRWIPLIASVGLAAYLVRLGCRAVSRRRPSDVQHAVQALVLSLILVDALLAFGARGPAAGLGVAALAIPAYLLARRYAST